MRSRGVTELRAERDLVARACRILGRLDLARENTGHVSLRASDDVVLIRARGPAESGVRFTTHDQVIAVELDGRKLDGAADLEPPLETVIHTAIYRARPDVRAVVHVHPPTVVLFTICDKPLEPLFGAYDPAALRLALSGLPTFDRSVLVTTDALGREVAATLGEKSACLMRGHGLVAVGPTVEEATVTAIKVNELAVMNYRAALLGGARPISDADRATFTADAAGAGRALGVWRYYARLLGDDTLTP
jgi:L-fuculose-phosphate aldolase